VNNFESGSGKEDDGSVLALKSASTGVAEARISRWGGAPLTSLPPPFIHDTAGCQTGFIVYTNIQLVVKPD